MARGRRAAPLAIAPTPILKHFLQMRGKEGRGEKCIPARPNCPNATKSVGKKRAFKFVEGKMHLTEKIVSKQGGGPAGFTPKMNQRRSIVLILSVVLLHSISNSIPSNAKEWEIGSHFSTPPSLRS